MAFLKKFSLTAVSSLATFLALSNVSINPAEAALFKFSFEGDGANGYFIFDDSAQKIEPIGSGYLGEYDGSVQEYAVNFYGQIVEQGFKGLQKDIHDEARTIVYLARPENIGFDGSSLDDFILYVPPASRGQQYGLSLRFSYPEGTFSNSIDQPKTLPNTARVRAYPYWDFPNTTGNYTFDGIVRTRLEKIPEPASVVGLLVLSVGFIFHRCRQSRQIQVQ
ncbi:PEP-CTERM sorting domain-containing protein [Scytonema sp. UIC 10036]|uniref:PEP-CTERM sorting domain-containing protein n=1 Tax=Scytonema sp. UIC 10036 TaxID=2304196 RepID=UPI0012DA3692|nr:PEP-CTERM sorting domain-containing protein [Scytonema sp. UIC 10036]MUG91041.1 PEP-CTERM sorting domain-containing protein [Scytonema sp. UIC 10036]